MSNSKLRGGLLHIVQKYVADRDQAHRLADTFAALMSASQLSHAARFEVAYDIIATQQRRDDLVLSVDDPRELAAAMANRSW